MMADLFPITIDDELAEVEREIALRKRVYPRWIDARRITREKADRHIALMQSVANRLAEYKKVLGG